MSARITTWGFIVALLALHGVVSVLTPLLGDDWDSVAWAIQHRHDASWITEFFSSHFTFSSIVGYLLARSMLFHAIVTPLMGLAVVVGTFVLATRRRPRFDDWHDTTGLVLIAAFIWIAAPRAGLVFFHRPFVATWLYSTAITIWFFVPLRCAIRLHAPWSALLVIAGLLVGTSTRQLGVFGIATVAYAIAKTPKRPRWMWFALAALVIGAVIGFIDRPFDFRGFRPGVERSLVALNLPIFEGGELISLVMGLVMVKLVIGKLWPRHAGEASANTSETLRWLAAWFGYCVLALFGPRYSEATLFPAAILLVIAAYPHVRWVVTSQPMKLVVLALALAINIVAWSFALSTYVPMHAEYRDRVATLQAAPRNSVATVTTYHQTRPSFWSFGEDWYEAARRQLIAAQIYRLRDIQLSPPFRRLESNPRLTMRVEVDGITPEQLRAAGAPDVWASTLRTARVQFGNVVAQLRRTISTPFGARLVIDLPLDILRGRKLLGASYENGALTTLKIQRMQPDDESRVAVRINPKGFVQAYPEAYAVIGDRATPVGYGKGYRVQALTTQLHAIVACDHTRCFLVEAFIPAF